MIRQPPDNHVCDKSLAAFPLAPDAWDWIAAEMQLSPQQRKIVELLLHRKKCKQIGPELGLAEPTVRTYLKRIYERHGLADHGELLIHIMDLSQRFYVSSRKMTPSTMT